MGDMDEPYSEEEIEEVRGSLWWHKEPYNGNRNAHVCPDEAKRIDRLIATINSLREERDEQKFLFEQKTDQWKRLNETCCELHEKWGKCQQENDKLKAELEGKWQPIETAPKEQGNLLCWDGKVIAICEWWILGGEWSVVHDAEGYAWEDYEPTHWQHLPQQPKGEG